MKTARTLSTLLLGIALLVAVTAGGWYVVHLRAQQAAQGNARPTAQPAAAGAEAPAVTGRTLSPEQRAAMRAKLGGPGGTPVNPIWFATMTTNPEAATFQREIQKVFEESGWQVRGNAPVTFPIKPGVYLFAAEDDPPPYVKTATEALEAAGMTVTQGSGYRAYYKQKKQENPAWNGFELAPDQTYVVVIGRQPESSATATPSP